MSVLIVGSVALDTIAAPAGKKTNILGGAAVYSSVSASCFAPVNIVGVVGEDFPRAHISMLQKKGIGLKGLEIVKGGKTFHWEGEYGADCGDPKTHATDLNVFATFDPYVPAEYRRSPYLFLANIDPDIQAKVLAQVARPKLVMLDTMNYWISSKRASLARLLKNIDIFLVNESEARQLSGERSLLKAARMVLKMGCKRLIIKKGEHGAMLFSKGSVFCAPAYLLEGVVDPTGAGDTFAGGFVGYCASQKNIHEATLRKALIYGNIMATFAVEAFSLQRLAAVKKADIEKRFQHYKRLTRF